jgi:GT2 family glycosyltransferase
MPTWIIMPVLNGLQMALNALKDCLHQSVPTRVLIINQGGDDALRTGLELASEADPERVFVWSHQPPLPSLAATWNRALRFVWAVGGEEALVINNDVRLHPVTVGGLKMNMKRAEALFVSAVGVTKEQYDRWITDGDLFLETTSGIPANAKGGPDFSCFLISRECHLNFEFDEGFIPLYGEDCDYHRRLMLAGAGSRIFSVNLPFLHLGAGSQTLKAMDPKARQALERQINQGSRAYYTKKWGGGVNQETFRVPFDPTSAVTDGSLTTPFLQVKLREAAC